MKRDTLVFAAAFLLGFSALMGEKSSTLVSVLSQVEMQHTSVNRSHDTAAEFVDVMLDEMEKLTYELNQANTLSELLGLAERLPCYDRDSNGHFRPVAEKLSRLYPTEALRYYAERPTNVTMNGIMWEYIVFFWAARDMTGCLNELEQGQSLTAAEFRDEWGALAQREWENKSEEITQHFAQMSGEKQKEILQRVELNESILSELLTEVNDPQFRSRFQSKLTPEVSQSEVAVVGNPQKQGIEMKREEREAIVNDIKNRNLAPQEIAALLYDVKSRADRHAIVSDALEKRGTEETIDGWLTRVKETMAVVNDIPDSPPAWRMKGDNSAYEALEKWIPHQTAKIQRAWADNVVNQMHGEDAMEWIDTLSQASLRADLRDQHLEQWVRNSPAEAAEYIVEKATVIEREDYLPTAVYRWALQDYAGAKQWMEAQADSPAKAAAMKKLEPRQ